MMTVTKQELLRLTEPVIYKVCAALDKVHAGVAIYAMLTLIVTLRRRTLMTMADIHKLLDDLGDTSQKLDN